MPQSKRIPFWRSLRTKFAMTYLIIVAAVLVLRRLFRDLERGHAPAGA